MSGTAGVRVKAYANSDHAYVVWRPSAKIDGCLGFALVRKGPQGKEETLQTWVGFSDDPQATPGTHKDSTVWPIQKFMWSDYFVGSNFPVSYRVIPMMSADGGLKQGTPSEWSAPVSPVPKTAAISAYFNRGIVASQWLTKRLGNVPPKEEKKKLAKVINDVNDKVRQFLAGELRVTMLQVLHDALESGGKVYAVLYELNDPELMSTLLAFGKRANVILANGTHRAKGKDDIDENQVARGRLKGKVNLSNRMVTGDHLAHNKFLVCCDGSDEPTKVWTGSTNWTETGLCTQANNGILINDGRIAAYFKQQWDALKAAGDGYPATLLEADAHPKTGEVQSGNMTVWFTPLKLKSDLADASRLIHGAQDGVLFLFFNPGPKGTLLNDILSLDSSRLYIHGVVNQDPGGKKNPVLLVHRGQKVVADYDVALPEAVDTRLKYWEPELKNYSLVMIHSKVVVVDPFGKHPVVMTGSHNLGPKASAKNDDNLVIIENDAPLAAEYAVNIMGIYNQYRWRYLRLNSGTPDRWDGLVRQDSWQDKYFDKSQQASKDFDFWFGD